MAISKSTLKKDTWKIVYDILKTIPDPKARGVQYWFASFPDTTDWAANKDRFPVCVLESPDISSNRFVLSKTPRRFDISMNVYLYSTRMQMLDELADAVFDKLDSNEATLESKGLHLYDFARSPISTSILNEQRIHECRIELGFRLVL